MKGGARLNQVKSSHRAIWGRLEWVSGKQTKKAGTSVDQKLANGLKEEAMKAERPAGG